MRIVALGPVKARQRLGVRGIDKKSYLFTMGFH
jgi:hypothetical protein